MRRENEKEFMGITWRYSRGFHALFDSERRFHSGLAPLCLFKNPYMACIESAPIPSSLGHGQVYKSAIDSGSVLDLLIEPLG